MKEKTKNHLKQFLMTLFATTISIVLTFGTSAIIERHHKEAAKKEMVMMIIYDFDKTLEQLQHADSVLLHASQAEMEIALHPEKYDSLRAQFMSAVVVASTEYLETTESIFSSNIETFNTLGNVNFVHEVSSFYSIRRKQKRHVFEELLNDIQGSNLTFSKEGLLNINFPFYCLSNGQSLVAMRDIRNRCMQMMKVSEKELEKFSRQRTLSEDHSEEDNVMLQQRFQDMMEFGKFFSNAIE